MRAQRRKDAAAKAAVAEKEVAEATATATATQDATAPTTSVTTPAAPAKPKSWAELLRSKNPPPTTAANPASGPLSDKTPGAGGRGANGNGTQFDGIADVLHKYKPSYSSPLIQPRGLVNNGNMCFMNAVSGKGDSC